MTQTWRATTITARPPVSIETEASRERVRGARGGSVIHPSGRQPSDPPWFRRRPGSPAGRRPGTTGWTPGSARSCSGFGLSLRYHFLSFSRVVPYVELFGAAGGTDLKRAAIDSRFTFLLHGGVGASVFVTDVVAIYA